MNTTNLLLEVGKSGLVMINTTGSILLKTKLTNVIDNNELYVNTYSSYGIYFSSNSTISTIGLFSLSNF